MKPSMHEITMSAAMPKRHATTNQSATERNASAPTVFVEPKPTPTATPPAMRVIRTMTPMDTGDKRSETCCIAYAPFRDMSHDALGDLTPTVPPLVDCSRAIAHSGTVDGSRQQSRDSLGESRRLRGKAQLALRQRREVVRRHCRGDRKTVRHQGQERAARRDASFLRRMERDIGSEQLRRDLLARRSEER